MKKNRMDLIAVFYTLKEKLRSFSPEEIENGVMDYFLSHYGYKENKYVGSYSRQVQEILNEVDLPFELETIIEFFEYLLEDDNKDENGIVFTPKYIAEYIAKQTLKELSSYDLNISILDPGCGCGIFLVAAAEYLAKRFSVSIDQVIENNIFGLDIDSDNARRCSLVLKLLSAKNGGNYEELKTNVKCEDSLKISWPEIFNKYSYSFIIGNPPYVNPHDMHKDTVRFLKSTFNTTKSGVFNIFYAFIEKALQHLSNDGVLGYIIPNNFLTIKSAMELRILLQSSKSIKSILDFADNMIFKPVRTYNCIVLLTKEKNETFDYCVMEKVDNIPQRLDLLTFNKMSTDSLDKNGWKLVDAVTRSNIGKIESQANRIKDFIRTGIATLRDGVYLVESDEKGYYKQFDSEKIYIEDELVKPIYKIPELKTCNSIDDVKRFIIFPYVKSNERYVLIDESLFAQKYPNTYKVLSIQREELDARDNGKGASQGWFAYGRSQGLNKYGKKLLFPTFSNIPRFTYVKNEDALFCNGYAVFENQQYDLDVLQKLLNSRIMEYYISNTSYSIEGGYYCYQKKYIEKFSIPTFSSEEIDYIRKATKEELDIYLWKFYGLE